MKAPREEAELRLEFGAVIGAAFYPNGKNSIKTIKHKFYCIFQKLLTNDDFW